MTRFGPVDIVFAPDGAPGGFADLAKGSVLLGLDGQRVRVITPRTWGSLKQAAGRPKDLEHLDSYYSVTDHDRSDD